jgi:alpha-glucosidase (family GH31 glycosyl hydrolase)
MYTLSAQAAKTGVGAVRPLWLEYPDDPDTLGAQAQYEFLSGPDFLVAPVYQDSETRDGIYLPKGTWTDYWTGRTYQGPTTLNGYHAPLDTLPLFVREGAIVPMWPKGTTSWQTRDRHELDWDLYPSAHGTSHYTLYEDDGVTRDFARGAAATQRVSVRSDAKGTTVSVGASAGDYAGKVDARSYRFTVHGDSAPARVFLDGRQLPDSVWSYDADTRVTTVTTPSLPLDRGFALRLM